MIHRIKGILNVENVSSSYPVLYTVQLWDIYKEFFYIEISHSLPLLTSLAVRPHLLFSILDLYPACQTQNPNLAKQLKV